MVPATLAVFADSSRHVTADVLGASNRRSCRCSSSSGCALLRVVLEVVIGREETVPLVGEHDRARGDLARNQRQRRLVALSHFHHQLGAGKDAGQRVVVLSTRDSDHDHQNRIPHATHEKIEQNTMHGELTSRCGGCVNECRLRASIASWTSGHSIRDFSPPRRA
jgi:hypothetical protein